MKLKIRVDGSFVHPWHNEFNVSHITPRKSLVHSFKEGYKRYVTVQDHSSSFEDIKDHQELAEETVFVMTPDTDHKTPRRKIWSYQH